MKLVQCHVENFGTLSDFDYVFQDGLNVIKEPNGFGKSTFAAFIKAMFYGFPRTGSRSIASNERKKYIPWQGGSYGGHLDFELDGVCYRITRTFGKTAAKDTYVLLDMSTRKESRLFSEKIGEELFQLDAESFMRSTYMPQVAEGGPMVTTSIRSKLSNLVDNTDDLNNYDTAMASLRASRSLYRKFRGNGGKIEDLEAEIESLERQILDAERDRALLDSATERLQDLKRQKKEQEALLKELRGKISRSSVQAVNRNLKKQREELQWELQETQNKIAELNKKNPHGYPGREEIRLMRNELTHIQQIQKRLSELKQNPQDEKIFIRGRELYGQEGDKLAGAGRKMGGALIGIGSILLILGIICFLRSQFVFGALLAVLGFCGVFGAFWLYTRQQKFREDFADYQQASLRVQEYYKNKNEYEKEQQQILERLNRLKKQYCLEGEITFPVIDQMEDDANTYALLSKSYSDMKHRLDVLEEEHPELTRMGASESDELLKTKELLQMEEQESERFERIDQELREKRHQCRYLKQITESIPEMEDKRNELLSQRIEAEQNCKVLDETMGFLEQAKEKLSTNYIACVENGFKKYAGELLGKDYEEALIDSDLEIHIDRNGAAREIGCFSIGTMDSVMMCMRLAMIDALFTKEKPFILLDDPFVNLDDLHTQNALKMLHKIAEKHQVIYMVCNSSRTM